MKRFIKSLFFIVIAAVVASFSVANRDPVKFIVDPFIDRSSAASIEAPLFLVLFAAFLGGVCVGGFVMWVTQAHWRSKAEVQAKEAALWKREAENLKQGLAVVANTQQTPGTQVKPLRSYI